LFANTLTFGGENDDAALLKVRRSVWIKWLENDQVALKSSCRRTRSLSARANPGSNTRRTCCKPPRHFTPPEEIDQPRIFRKRRCSISGMWPVTWSDYVLELEVGGKQEKTIGRVVEIFCEAQRAVDQSGWHTDSESFPNPSPTSDGESEDFCLPRKHNIPGANEE